jgi:mannose-6-phosphate isomerase class I
MKKKTPVVTSLRASLSYQPVELRFGTSGLRGLVRDITSLETYVNTRGFLSWLLETGDVVTGDTVYAAGDLRPSTVSIVAEEGLRGEILQAACKAVEDCGLSAGFLGMIPTPALALHAMRRKAAGIMVTGSHIPFDRNGIKFYKPAGEVLKEDEAGILLHVAKVREEQYGMPFAESLFSENGMLRAESTKPLAEPGPEAAEGYLKRYTAAFPPGGLAGKKVLVWQHSAVGRDLLVRALSALGAEAVPVGRSDSFVPVDTEAVDKQMLQTVQGLVDAHGGASIDAVVSTDGDGDRPLVLAVDGGTVRFFPGDLLGLVTADYLGARHVAVPVSASDAVDLYCHARGIEVARTRIGSPHVIAAMKEVGWEGNGGFLTAVTIPVPAGGTLEALPTRDAMLPILSCLCHAGKSLAALLDALPPRFGRSTLLRDFPVHIAQEIVQWLSPTDPSLREARYEAADVRLTTASGDEDALALDDPRREELAAIRGRIQKHFTAGRGFAEPRWINWLDGVRIGFANNDVAHLRPSGNAPEMRFYALSGTQKRTDAMAALGVSDEGILRGMQRDAADRIAIASFQASPRQVVLQGALQHYDWGGYGFLPEMLGMDNPDKRPFAELWLGAHPRAPALADVDGVRVPLDRLVSADPWLIMGSDVALRFAGQLPYLFKVLDVRLMATLQAHPSKAQAEDGFSRENAAGIPIDAPNRNYRDENHKPEAHVVLTDFWMLHGFRPLEEIAETFGAEPELRTVMPAVGERLRAAPRDAEARSALLRDLFTRVMTMAQTEVDALVNALVARLEAEEGGGGLTRDSHGFWALRAARTFPLADGHRDRGILSLYMLNLVRLKPGQGTFQPSGTLHAYLEGANVEIMANSDNVLRCGLTPKHVDVPELITTLTFRDGRPHILEGRASSETGREYETPAEEFALERIEISPGTPYAGGREHSADSLIVTDGAAAVVAAGRTLVLPRGGAALVPAALPYSIAARAARTVIFKAGVPPKP